MGESNYQNHLKAFAGNHGTDTAAVAVRAILMPEPTNPYDKDAVYIYINGKTVGYLPKDDAPIFLRRLTKRKLSKTSATTCDALIMGGFVKKDGSKASYGVKLNMLPFYEDYAIYLIAVQATNKPATAIFLRILMYLHKSRPQQRNCP